MKNKFVFVYTDSERLLAPGIGIFRDLEKDKDTDFAHITKKGGRLLNFFVKLVLSRKINSIIEVPFKNRVFDFYNNCCDENINYYFIIPTASMIKLEMSFLKELQEKHPNYFFIALVTDSLKSHSVHLNYVRDKLKSNVWTLVTSFDKQDSKEFGFSYFGYSFYSDYSDVKPSGEFSDIYYIGRIKTGREKIAAKLYDRLISNEIKCNFKVVSEDPEHSIGSSCLKTTKRKYLYPEVVADVKCTNCILELLQQDQETQTTRYLEAVVYNKKLITNNRHLAELPFYDSRYMKYFETVDDIDPEWIRKEEPIDYGYNGEFSSLHYLDFIKKELEIN